MPPQSPQWGHLWTAPGPATHECLETCSQVIPCGPTRDCSSLHTTSQGRARQTRQPEPTSLSQHLTLKRRSHPGTPMTPRLTVQVLLQRTHTLTVYLEKSNKQNIFTRQQMFQACFCGTVSLWEPAEPFVLSAWEGTGPPAKAAHPQDGRGTGKWGLGASALQGPAPSHGRPTKLHRSQDLPFDPLGDAPGRGFCPPSWLISSLGAVPAPDLPQAPGPRVALGTV